MAKAALLIGVKDYAEGLKPLPAAQNDVAAMQDVLQNPEMGGFDEVKTLVNPNHSEMAVEIELWFSELQRDDLAVLFFSGHGVKNKSRELYFAASDTRKIKERLLQSTAVSANFVRGCLKSCKSKRQVVILDCCFSGAFGDLLAKDDGGVDLESQLGTEGGVVLTSSSSLQYSFEQEGSDLSIYTRYLVEGIRTGAADEDGDGAVSVDELHQYASRKVQTTAPAMTPKIIVLKDEGFRIKLTKAPIGDPKLKYRKEAERLAKESISQSMRVAYKGEFPIVARAILDNERDKLRLSPDEAKEIEAQVLQPYVEHQDKLNKYGSALESVLQGEYPLSTYNRNNLKDYQKHLGLKDEDVERIEQPIFAKNETDNLSSERGVDYTKLQDLLAQGQWREADEETLAVMLRAANREKEGYLNIESIEKFPCTDLRTIDQLWVKYSNGRFGFSVQKRIWESVGGKPGEYDYEIYQKFGDRVGWRGITVKQKKEKKWLGLIETEKVYEETEWLEHQNNLFIERKAQQGHLPRVFMGWCMGVRGGVRCWFSLASRLVKCNI